MAQPDGGGGDAEPAAKKKVAVYVLIALGFAGLIGAYERATRIPMPGEHPSMTIPFIVAALATLCFVAAGLMARGLMKEGVPK